MLNKKETKYLQSRVFEPGTHVIHYLYNLKKWYSTFGGKEGYGTGNFVTPEVPEGYKILNVMPLDEGCYGATSSILFFFVNTETVIANADLGPNNTIVYPLPGEVVPNYSLKL